MLRWVFRISFYFCTVLTFTVIVALSWVKLTYADKGDLKDLQNGDLIFQTTNTSLTWPIMLASSSVYTHMGIIQIGPDGRKLVVEAAGPVRVRPLKQWIKSGVGRRITVMRVKGLSKRKAQQALKAALAYRGIAYDFFFLMTDDKFYCSELVYKAFKKVGITLGKEERVRDLSIANFAVRNYIKKKWRKHPICKKKGIRDYKNCLEIILNQKLVTPVSIARDSKLRLIYTNYGPNWMVKSW